MRAAFAAAAVMASVLGPSAVAVGPGPAESRVMADRLDPQPDDGILRPGDRGPAVGYLQVGLTDAGHPTPVTKRYDRRTTRSVTAFQKRVGLKPTGVAHKRTLNRLVAEARPTFADACDEMSWYRQRVGLPAVFDSIGWRESRCLNRDDVRTYCCYGWWQLYPSLHIRDHRMAPKMSACGVKSYADINSDTPEDKTRQACYAKALYDTVGLSAWAATAP